MLLLPILRTVAGPLGVAVLVFGGYWFGFNSGENAANVQFELARLELEAKINKASRERQAAELARLEAEEETQRLADELEAQAQEDPNASNLGIGPDSVIRLQRR